MTSAPTNSAQLLQAAIGLHNAGRLGEAEALYRQVLEVEPQNADALHLLGLIAYHNGNPGEAIGLVRRAVAAHDRAPDYHYSLANMLNAAGSPAEAEAAFRKTLALLSASNHSQWIAEANNNLGSLLQRQGRLSEAIAVFREAVKHDPEQPVFCNNLGASLEQNGEAGEAEVCYRRALEIVPDYRDALLNLGNVLSHQGRHAEAIELYQRVLAIDPKFAIAHNNLGNALKGQGRLAESLAAYKDAISINPDFPEAWSNYLLSLGYAEGFSPQFIFDAHLEFAKRFEESLKAVRKPHANDPDPGRKLKVGYVSPDFRRHAVSYFIGPVLENHDRDRFEIYCYYNNASSDEATLRIKSQAQHFREIAAINDEQAAQLIREDGIDILVDLSGHTGGNRLLVFARKPAPVQVSWLGYGGSTGLSSIDWRISDPYIDSSDAQNYYSEQLCRLPDTCVCYQPDSETPDPVFLQQEQVTFASFNALSKMTAEVRALWAKVLLEVPGSRLMLKTGALQGAEVRQALVEEFSAYGIEKDRLELVPWDASHHDHLARYNRVDIGLDPFPYNGGTTSFEAMWMGVPVVTLEGEGYVSRMGKSLLSNVGLEDLVAKTPEDYVKIAANLASDPVRLSELRSGLRERMRNSPLANAALFTRNLEAAYRQMWQKWCGQ